MNGYIRIYRQMLEWEWFTDANTLKVWLYCLLKANWKDGKFRGVDVPRGTFITSIDHMAKELKMTNSELRTALKHLEISKNITRKATSKWTAITVENYELFQSEPQTNRKQSDKRTTNKSQTNDKQIATIEERKKAIKKKSNLSFKSEREDGRIFDEISGMYLTPAEMETRERLKRNLEQRL